MSARLSNGVSLAYIEPMLELELSLPGGRVLVCKPGIEGGGKLMLGGHLIEYHVSLQDARTTPEAFIVAHA